MFDLESKGFKTLVAIACVAMLFAIIAFGLGFFIDPTMSQGTRGGIVIGWLFASPIGAIATFLARHG